ncbi:ATP-binding protein [Streptomyces ipomoeae]|uniref:ATP-binding protein n=1 Tax=Streptomyces ipomoeae TaxID=103232 RepID=UPI0011473BE2|nr:ATP-binding protein [Streptomyces ipomoeae]MDX2936925.1 ATP-binding protein [Streptomyces ipomoeae]TQE15266.1 ATP-binding protein [Streptomyces ipomoeae]
MDCIAGVPRKPWALPFVAEPEGVASLRRIVRLHLSLWGLHDVIDAAQLCVSELVANVINHVGVGTPTTLAVSMNGTLLRIEVHDPDARALPTLLDAATVAESGRGMMLVSAVADRWGVQPHADGKVTWCELETGLASASGHTGGVRVARAEAILGLYGTAKLPLAARPSPLTIALAEESVTALIADLLHWVRAHGYDADEALDRAQSRFDAEISS